MPFFNTNFHCPPTPAISMLTAPLARSTKSFWAVSFDKTFSPGKKMRRNMLSRKTCHRGSANFLLTNGIPNLLWRRIRFEGIRLTHVDTIRCVFHIPKQEGLTTKQADEVIRMQWPLEDHVISPYPQRFRNPTWKDQKQLQKSGCTSSKDHLSNIYPPWN